MPTGPRCIVIGVVIYVCIATSRMPIKGGCETWYFVFRCSKKTACVTAKNNGTKNPRGFQHLYISPI